MHSSLKSMIQPLSQALREESRSMQSLWSLTGFTQAPIQLGACSTKMYSFCGCQNLGETMQTWLFLFGLLGGHLLMENWLCANAVSIWLRVSLRELACRCAMFKLRVPVLDGALAVSLRLPHCSKHIGSLSSATTCKLPRDLTSLVWHRELAKRREAVNSLLHEGL